MVYGLLTESLVAHGGLNKFVKGFLKGVLGSLRLCLISEDEDEVSEEEVKEEVKETPMIDDSSDEEDEPEPEPEPPKKEGSKEEGKGQALKCVNINQIIIYYTYKEN